MEQEGLREGERRRAERWDGIAGGSKRDPGAPRANRGRGGRSFLRCHFPNLKRDLATTTLRDTFSSESCFSPDSRRWQATHSSTSFLLPQQPPISQNHRATIRLVSTRLDQLYIAAV